MRYIRKVLIGAVRDGAVKRADATGLEGEVFTDAEFVQEYGLTSRPRSGASGVAAAQGNMVTIIASDDRRYRLVIDEGEVALYDDQGQKVHLKQNGEIEVSALSKVTVSAPAVELGSGTLRRLIDERIVHIINQHTHPYTDDGNPMVTGAPVTPIVLDDVATAQTKAA